MKKPSLPLQLILTWLPLAAAGPVGGVGLDTGGGAEFITGGGLSGGTIPRRDMAEGSVGVLIGLGLWPNLPIRAPGREASLATYSWCQLGLLYGYSVCTLVFLLTFFVTVWFGSGESRGRFFPSAGAGFPEV